MNDGPIKQMFEGPIDVVGDVHGEIGPLRELLRRLGYDQVGRHLKGRRLVFVGDLGDRGPNSPAVIELVRAYVGLGHAQCLLGNHELNLLRGESKPGNRWFTDPAHQEQRPGGEFEQSRVAPEPLKPIWMDFFASLPLALVRKDLRVVHAAWLPGAMDGLRQAQGSTLDMYREFEVRVQQQLALEGLTQTARRQEQAWARHLEERSVHVPLLPALGEVDERYQMGNPVRVATSGVERLAQESFWSNGRWRMCQRVRWWEEYDEPIPVIIGHYWRQAQVTPKPIQSIVATPNTFDRVAATTWVGARQNVFCVDFCAGARYQERKAGLTRYATHLAAMRWPEQELWFEAGKVA